VLVKPKKQSLWELFILPKPPRHKSVRAVSIKADAEP
jgi:hypothetical protein